MRSTVFRIAMVLAVSSGGLGCHLYHPGRDQLARQVQKDFDELDISASVDDEKKLSDEMLESELEASRKYQDAIRDQQIAMLLDMPLAKSGGKSCAVTSLGQEGSLVCIIDTELDRVGGPEAAEIISKLPALEQGEADLAREARKLVLAINEKPLRDALPSLVCTDANRQQLKAIDPVADPKFAAGSEEGRALLKQALAAYARDGGLCARILQIRAKLPGLKGEIGDAIAQLARARGQWIAAKEAGDQLSDDYDAAYEAYVAVKERKTKLETRIADLKAAEATLQDALKKLDDGATSTASLLNGVGLSGNPVDVAALEAKVHSATSAIRGILQDATETYEESGFAAVVAKVIEYQKIEQERSLPVLLLEAEVLRGRLARARAEEAAGAAQMAALDDQVSALVRAAQQLLKARLALSQNAQSLTCAVELHDQNVGTLIAGKRAWKPPAPMSDAQLRAAQKDAERKKAEAALQPGDIAPPPLDACQRGVAEAMVRYADAWTLGFSPARVAHLRFIGAIERGSLSSSAAALEMWESVLAAPMGQLVEYHAGGVKPEDVAAIIVQAAGFTGLTAATAAGAAK